MSTTTPKNLGDEGSGNEIKRVRRIIIDVPYNNDARCTISANQEQFTDVSGELKNRQKIPPIRRNYDAVKAESFSFDGVTATVEQIRGLMAEALDAWRAADEA